jgi:predicted DNA-binding protein (UPF0251 family)
MTAYFTTHNSLMPAGRKKKERNICIDWNTMLCDCFGPLKVDKDVLTKREKIYLEADELQSLIYQDIDGLTMDVACKKLWVSKTVYAGIYSSARNKTARAISQSHVLFLPKQ